MLEDKNLGLKVATQEEAIWINVKESCETRIKQMENSLIVEREFLKLAKKKTTKIKKQPLNMTQ